MKELTSELVIKLIDQLSGPAAKGTAALGKFGAGAHALDQELQRQRGAERQLAQFQKLQTGVAQSRRAFVEAEANVRRLAVQMRAGEAPTRKLQAEYAKAQKTASAMAAALDRNKVAALASKRAIEQVAGPLRTVASAQERARAETDRLTAALERNRRAAEGVARAEHRAGEIRARRREAAGVIASSVGLMAAEKGREIIRSVAENFKAYDDLLRYQTKVSDLNPAEVKSRQSQALRLGGSTKFNDLQVLEAQNMLAQRGVKKNLVEMGVEEAVNFAQAMNVKLPEATKTLEGAIFTMGQNVDDAATAQKTIRRNVDLLTYAAKHSGFSAEGLGEAFKHGAPTAHGAGMSTETLLGLMGTLHRGGFEGSETGVAARAFATHLVSPTRQGMAALDAMGVRFRDFTKAPEAGLSPENLSATLKRSLGHGIRPAAMTRLEEIMSDEEVVGDQDKFIASVVGVLRREYAKRGARHGAQDDKALTKVVSDFYKMSLQGVDVQGLFEAILKANPTAAQANALVSDKHGGKLLALAGKQDFFEKFVKEMRNVPEFYAKGIGDYRTAGFAGAMDRLTGSALNAATRIGLAFDDDGKGGSLTRLVDAAAHLTQGFAELDPVVIRSVTRLTALAAGAGAVYGGFRLMSNLLGSTSKGSLIAASTALDGSALALDGSAAALTAAAEKIALGGSLGKGVAAGEGLAAAEAAAAARAADAAKGAAEAKAASAPGIKVVEGMVDAGVAARLGGTLKSGVIGAIVYEIGNDLITGALAALPKPAYPPGYDREAEFNRNHVAAVLDQARPFVRSLNAAQVDKAAQRRIRESRLEKAIASAQADRAGYASGTKRMPLGASESDRTETIAYLDREILRLRSQLDELRIPTAKTKPAPIDPQRLQDLLQPSPTPRGLIEALGGAHQILLADAYRAFFGGKQPTAEEPPRPSKPDITRDMLAPPLSAAGASRFERPVKEGVRQGLIEYFGPPTGTLRPGGLIHKASFGPGGGTGRFGDDGRFRDDFGDAPAGGGSGSGGAGIGGGGGRFNGLGSGGGGSGGASGGGGSGGTEGGAPPAFGGVGRRGLLRPHLDRLPGGTVLKRGLRGAPADPGSPGPAAAGPGARSFSRNTPIHSLSRAQRDQLLNEMQKQEGWRPGTTSYSQNNPGNINYSKYWGEKYGATSGYGNIARFPTYEAGRKAMEESFFDRAGRQNPTTTLAEAFAGNPSKKIRGYTPAVRDQFGRMGHPEIYADRVARALVPETGGGSATASNASVGPAGEPVAGTSAPPLAAAPGRHPDVKNVDPKLLASATAAAAHLPPGYRVVVTEGYNPAGHVARSMHHKKGQGALDLQIIGPDGRAIPNKGNDTTGMYTTLARHFLGEATARGVPANRIGTGRNFGTVTGGRTPDLMHFDFGGKRGDIGTPTQDLGPMPGELYGQALEDQLARKGRKVAPLEAATPQEKFGAQNNPLTGGRDPLAAQRNAKAAAARLAEEQNSRARVSLAHAESGNVPAPVDASAAAAGGGAGARHVGLNTPLASLSARQREQMIDAMQKQEGWRPGTTSYKYNNPGNIMWHEGLRKYGAVPSSFTNSSGTIAKFPNYRAGREAMKDLLFHSKLYGGRTIFSTFAGVGDDPRHRRGGYAPEYDARGRRVNNPLLYAKNVASGIAGHTGAEGVRAAAAHGPPAPPAHAFATPAHTAASVAADAVGSHGTEAPTHNAFGHLSGHFDEAMAAMHDTAQRGLRVPIHLHVASIDGQPASMSPHRRTAQAHIRTSFMGGGVQGA